MIPAFKDRCIPAGFVARPLRERYPGGRAERFGEEGLAQTCGLIARRATKRRPPPRQRSRSRAPLRRGVRTRRTLRLVLPRRSCLGVLQQDARRVELFPDPGGLGEVLLRAGGRALLGPALEFLGGGISRPDVRLR